MGTKGRKGVLLGSTWKILPEAGQGGEAEVVWPLLGHLPLDKGS